MFTTAIAILGAVALLSPGFLIVELSDARRARAKRSDLELTLRALVYSVLVHVAFCWWTADLVSRIGAVSEVDDHLHSVVLYVFVVLFMAPVVAGVAISSHLRTVERKPEPPGLLSAALGAGRANDAFDFAFQQHHEGAWVIVELVGSTPESPRYIGGLYGRRSAIGQAPSPHDVYLENAARVGLHDDGSPFIASLVRPSHGVYLPAGQIARIDLFTAADGGAIGGGVHARNSERSSQASGRGDARVCTASAAARVHRSEQ